MATTLITRINYIDADVDYNTTPADYIDMDFGNDYLIWTKSGSSVVKDLMTYEPTSAELNTNSTEIDPSSDVDVALCLLMDYSHDVGGSYYTHTVKGMGENKRYVFCFSFDGATASEPQLEAWDDSDHDSYGNHVLGAGTPANSMIKAVCTTGSLPGASWAGTAIAGDGATRVVQLNDGNGALSAPASGDTNDLYANIKIVIPAGYSTPGAETFVLLVRFTWN